jgi:hypothetical protein
MGSGTKRIMARRESMNGIIVIYFFVALWVFILVSEIMGWGKE